MESLDRRIMLATQGGLPLVSQPYQWVAEQLGVTAGEVMERIDKMLADGRIRRIGAVPNHYRLGYVGNGMSVWDVADEDIDAVGDEVGRLPFVSHCYRRPRIDAQWPYNLFAMVHGHGRDEVRELVEKIERLLGPRCRAHEVLFSTRILKKTGIRFVS